MKIEMPQEPEVERLWLKESRTGEIRELAPAKTMPGWTDITDGGHYAWPHVLALGPVYTTHPDLAALDKYPAPFTVSPAGTIRDATGKAVLDPNQQCPPCLTRFFMRAANFFAEHYDPSVGKDEKR